MQVLSFPASASSDADLPRESLTQASALRSSSNCATSALPRKAAVHRAYLTHSSYASGGKSSLLEGPHQWLAHDTAKTQQYPPYPSKLPLEVQIAL